MQRPDEPARTILRVGLPRLAGRAQEVLDAVTSYDPKRSVELTRRLALIPGAEALGILVGLAERDRMQVLSDLEIGDDQRRLLSKILSIVGDRSDARPAVAAAIQVLSYGIDTNPSKGREPAKAQTELNLRFPDPDHVIVRFGPDDDGTGELPFANPFTDRDLLDLQWYIETYGAHSLGDPDDQEAARIAHQLPDWGDKLFNAVFQHDTAKTRFLHLWESENDSRLLTISAEQPAILGLPWELLHHANAGGHLFLANPRISIRRRVAGATGIGLPFVPVTKDRLHLLFVISRPADAGFLDPRADAQPVLDAIDEHSPGSVTCEFLRQPTLDALLERLEDRSKPAVDILHFDGHGVFDREGGLPKRVEEARGHRLRHAEEISRDKRTGDPHDPDCPPNTGYLLFEKPDGQGDFVSAETLGANLHRHRIALVVLSAGGSVATGNTREDNETRSDQPIGGVAARLTAAGIPSVLAMTHSVLVHSTRTLFGTFYKELARHKGIGEALDNARRNLFDHPEKYEVQRGPKRVPLKLYDWFLPALYQQGKDAPLLKRANAGSLASASPPRSNLPPAPETGFFGRKRQLWEIERWFAGPTRRISVTGFGGQGKTALALEAGRWLTRTGMFQAAVFVDYSRVQARDAATVAVREIGSVLGETLIDAQAATAALVKTPTLLILDNLEALAPESLQALLDAAVPWSRAGGSRVLCTTRRPEFGHAEYKTENTFVHRRISVDGLGSVRAPDDALEWCAALMRLPPVPTVPAPNRQSLIALFDRVRFHPLSIHVLTQQLKTRPPEALGQRLEQLLANRPATSTGTEDTPAELVASLELSLDKLDQAARQVLPRLGVFQGGAMEADLLAITGLDESQWPDLRRQLEAAALIEAEDLDGVTVPFLRFHPTLAPMLWAQLDPAEQTRLSDAHQRRYYAVSGYLYNEDQRNPHEVRAIAWRELPNLLQAVHRALDAKDPDAVDFADSVNSFLGAFGLKQEAESLAAKVQTVTGETGSKAWFMAQSNRGARLFAAGQVAEAGQVFQAILKQLGDEPTYERAMILGDLGRCLRAGGRPDLAAHCASEAIAVCDRLEPSDGVKRHRGVILTDLADALSEQGKLEDARKTYEESMRVSIELNDLRGQGVKIGQLGSLAMLEGNSPEAIERYRTSLSLFQQLREPKMEAVAWHQLGRAFQEAGQWDEAERHYRESARISEEQGDLPGAARTWNQLAAIGQRAGKLDAAERWYRKAIEGGRAVQDSLGLAWRLSNLGNLLQSQPGRLTEARQLAEEALAIMQALDPGAAQIWVTYGNLAEIAEKEAVETANDNLRTELETKAREYRRLAREAKRNFAGTRHELRQHLPLILGTIEAVHDLEQRKHLEQALPGFEQYGWTNLVAAIRRILAGEGDADALCTALDLEDAMIIETILAGLADPATLSDLQPSKTPTSD